MSLVQELRYGVRTLGKAPGFTALVVLTLAIGIAVTTAIFSVVYGVVLRPLPFSEPDRLVRICETNESVAGFCVVSPPNAMDWSRQSQTFEEIGLARISSFVIQSQDGADKVFGSLATPGSLRVFHVAPLLGRLLEPEDLESGQRVAVLSYGFWQSRFGNVSDVLGQTLTLNGENYSIVGVLRPEVEIPGLKAAQFWVPLPFLGEEHRLWRGFQAVGRLRAGVTLGEARSEMTTLAARLAQQYPEANEGWGVALVPLHELVVGPVRRSMLVFLGAGAFVLLIGCTNVASLLLSRAVGRQKEMALRASLGAGRWRLVRLLLTESLLLAVLGGVAGLVLAHGVVKAFLALAPGGIPRLHEVTLDGTVFAFAALVSLLTGLLFGVAPALRATMVDLSMAIKTGSQEPPGMSRLGLRGMLVVSEVALAMLLLIGAGLLIRSFVRAMHWHGGFDHENLLLLSVRCSDSKYVENQQVANLYLQAVRELEALPGVLSAGAASAGPLFGSQEMGEFFIEDGVSQEPRAARWFDMDPNYFHTLGIPLVKGRYFTAQDRAGALSVAIVNETMARRFWPDEDPIGQRVRWATYGPAREIVGVVADVKPLWPESEVDPEIYWPNLQEPRWATFLVVRQYPELPSVADAVRNRLRDLDPDTSVSQVFTFEQRLQERLVRPRFNMLLLGSFAFVALVLALGGTYGVISYDVSRRRREIGLRMAMGAGRREILRWMIGRGLKLTAIGIGGGLLGAFAFTKVLSSMLYATSPTDVVTFFSVAGLLALAALLACYVPARRAAWVDPMAAIRSE